MAKMTRTFYDSKLIKIMRPPNTTEGYKVVKGVKVVDVMASKRASKSRLSELN
jgi:hypothetical protein